MQTWDEVLKELKAWFPVGCHQQRKLKGGGQWWFVPWQDIRDRLDDVLGHNWEISYGTPLIDVQANTCAIECKITIVLGDERRTRSAWGSVPISELSGKGNEMTQGSPIDRSQAESFKNAAEAWGLCRYLDWQRQPENPTPRQKEQREEWARYMHRQGNSRPAMDWQNEQKAKAAAAPRSPAPKPTPQKQQPPEPAPGSNPIARTSPGVVDQFTRNLESVKTLDDGMRLGVWLNQKAIATELDEVPGTRSLLLSKLTQKLANEMDLSSVMVAIDAEMTRLKLSANDGKDILKSRYNKHSRHMLTIGELLDFLGAMRNSEGYFQL